MRPINSSKNKLNSKKNKKIKKKLHFSATAKHNLNLNEEFDQFPIQEKHKIWFPFVQNMVSNSTLIFAFLEFKT